MAKKTVQKTIKVKKKKWYPILAPRTFNESVIGETPATDAESIVGKIVSANLMNLTGDMKKQNINMKFVVTEIKGDHAHTETSRYQMIPALIKQLVRRRRDRIDDSIICKTKDNKIINIKPIILTRSNTKTKFITV